MRFTKIDETAFLKDLRDKVLTENISLLSRGTMLFRGHGVMLTDDIEQEFISSSHQDTIVETEHAQELSWLFREISEGISDTMTSYTKEEFYGLLADAANAFLLRSTDRTGMLLSVLMEASLMVSSTRQRRCDDLKDEVLSCAASLSDLAEKI